MGGTAMILKSVYDGIKGLIAGYAVTITKFFSRGTTVPYPEKTPFVSERWRGVHGLFFTDNRFEELCVSCHLCAKVCPSVCITMEGSEDYLQRKRLKRFDVDLGRCIYCGYCEEVCPADAIRLTTSHDYVSRDRENLILHKEDLIEIGKSAMRRGEHGALGIRRGDGKKVVYQENRNLDASFKALSGERVKR
ncbi:MAG: hypothetical protein COS94_01825 [Candidatus Hydrogenedentes bacterium CG07_land_8_20_14_0_80_42_17]|nr:MAG: hypothetical protein COS94_01825 [Candidatus Hydrogenedentes bacterium CG07_land_8_20_14_0_80_42_17]